MTQRIGGVVIVAAIAILALLGLVETQPGQDIAAGVSGIWSGLTNGASQAATGGDAAGDAGRAFGFGVLAALLALFLFGFAPRGAIIVGLVTGLILFAPAIPAALGGGDLPEISVSTN